MIFYSDFQRCFYFHSDPFRKDDGTLVDIFPFFTGDLRSEPGTYGINSGWIHMLQPFVQLALLDTRPGGIAPKTKGP